MSRAESSGSDEAEPAIAESHASVSVSPAGYSGARGGGEMKVLSFDREAKTAKVELFGKTRTLQASSWGEVGTKDEHITVYGIAVRYPTGTKVWHGTFTYWPVSGNINGVRNSIDHHARFANLSVVGFYEDVREQYRSRR